LQDNLWVLRKNIGYHRSSLPEKRAALSYDSICIWSCQEVSTEKGTKWALFSLIWCKKDGAGAKPAPSEQLL
jgi:hypothetical protein